MRCTSLCPCWRSRCLLGRWCRGLRGCCLLQRAAAAAASRCELLIHETVTAQITPCSSSAETPTLKVSVLAGGAHPCTSCRLRQCEPKAGADRVFAAGPPAGLLTLATKGSLTAGNTTSAYLRIQGSTRTLLMKQHPQGPSGQ
jgi:hypothetical protein